MCLGGGDRSPRPVHFTTHPKLRPGSSGPGAAKTSGRPTTKDTPEMDIRPSHPSEDLIPAHRAPSFYPLGQAPGVSSQEPGIATAAQDCFSGESQVSVCLWASKSQCNEPQHYLGSFRSCCIPSASTAIIHSSTQAQLVIACHSATCCLTFNSVWKGQASRLWWSAGWHMSTYSCLFLLSCTSELQHQGPMLLHLLLCKASLTWPDNFCTHCALDGKEFNQELDDAAGGCTPATAQA